MGPRFYLQILPLSALGALGTAVGLRTGALGEEPASTAAALAIGLGCFFAGRAFRSHPGWMALFISGLSLAAGSLLARTDLEHGLAPAIAAAVVLLVAAVIGRAMRAPWSALYTPLWLGAWLLIFVLIGVWLAGGAEEWAVPLALITCLTFSGLSVAWFARLPAEATPAAAMDLYLLGFNLFLTFGILQAGIA